ncbi:hypothetical protein CPB86DRAFT_789830 [Serendipita vermifera]|nr:hypothetical protein CPB86DRAFT_789830 [Serendipita vermifera]
MDNQQSPDGAALKRPLGPKGIAQIRDFIKAREEDLNYLTKRLEEERSRIDSTLQEITHFEVAIPPAKMGLEAYEKHIESLRAMRSSLQSLQEAGNGLSELKSFERYSRGTKTDILQNNKDLTEEISNHTLCSLSMVENQVSASTRGYEKLSRHLIYLEDELIGWRFTNDLANNCHSQLESIIHKLKPWHDSAKSEICNSIVIPEKIWIKIFRVYFSIETRAYLTAERISPSIPAPFLLSSVCRNWRRIVHSEASLSSFLPFNPIPFHRSSSHFLLR